MKEILDFYTTAEKKAEGKTKIYVLCRPEEAKLIKNVAEAELREYCDGAALFYPADFKGLEDSEYRENILASVSQMDGVFVCVTQGMLSGDTFEKELILKALSDGKTILPYFCEPGLTDAWNSFLEIQAIDPYNTDPTQIPYRIKLGNWVSKITPLSENETEEIWKSFDGKIFISYRKLDRKYIDPLMRSVHGDVRNNPLAFCGMWYDEALTSDDNFNNIIAANIQDSDLYLMLVTPNTFKPNEAGLTNYVISKEYPAFIRNGKPIVGVYTADTDLSLARETFPKVTEWVPYEDSENICMVVFSNMANSTDPAVKTPDDLYRTGLAYLKGIGAETNMDNAVILFLNAAKGCCHKEALRRLTEICFDENEKSRGADGFYAPSEGFKFEELLIKASIEESDGSDAAISKAVDEQLKMAGFLEKLGTDTDLEKAFRVCGVCRQWFLENAGPSLSDTLSKVLGRILIIMGRMQYLRHFYRHKDLYGREDGAINFLTLGIEYMLRRPKVKDLSLKEVYTLTGAFDCLSDSYYKTACFSLQKEAIAEKLDLVETYALNDMDRSQILERADSRSVLAEANLMCGRACLEDAMSAYGEAGDLLDKASEIYDDSQIFIRRIKLFNSWGLAFLCKKDIAGSHDQAKEYEDTAYELLKTATDMCIARLYSPSPSIPESTLKYLLGVTCLHMYQTTKSFSDSSRSLQSAVKYLIETVTDDRDFDALHYLYRAKLEAFIYNTHVLFSNLSQTDVSQANKMLDDLTETIYAIDDDQRKRKNYWIALDLIEMCNAKAKFLIKAYESGLAGASVLREIDTNLNAALVHGQRAYDRDGTPKSRVLLGALSLVCETYRYFYFKTGHEAEADHMQALRGRYNREIYESPLNDYTR